MRFKNHYSIVHADKVLTLVKRLGADVPSLHEVDILQWSNGREQGYSLRLWMDDKPSRQVCFAQQRSSDAVVVLKGHGYEFDISTNMPTAGLWPYAAHFHDDEKAAQYIVNFLSTGK
jgi:hypothetical protein